MNDRLRTLGRRVGFVLVAVVLVCLAIVVAGYVVGPNPGVQSAPAVDVDEPPPEVVADATAQLWVRDHTWEQWTQERNLTTGAARGGIVAQVRVQHSRKRVRVTQWDFLYEENETVEPTDPPVYEGFSRRHAAWGSWTDEDDWNRITGIEPVYGPRSSAPVYYNSQFRNASMTVVSENESALAVRTSDERALEALEMSGAPGNVTVTFVVAKTENPYLSRVTVRHQRNESVDVNTYRVSAVGNTTAPKPDGVPAVTPVEVVRRTYFGVESLLG